MRLICTGITDVGLTRDHNEDNFWLEPDGEALCIVADGMGGHRSGEVASRIAIETIVQHYRDTVIDPDDELAFKSPFSWPFRRKKSSTGNNQEERLVQGLLAANSAIYKSSSENELYKGMGTTIVACYFVDHGVYIAHIGDSRGYRLRNDTLELLTEDHSLANEYVRMGILSPEDLEHFPYKNVITRACGLAAEVEVEVDYEEIQDGDVYLFCSDGLTDCVPDLKIREIMRSIPDLDACAEALVDAANEGGGTDNITVLLAKTLLV